MELDPLVASFVSFGFLLAISDVADRRRQLPYFAVMRFGKGGKSKSRNATKGSITHTENRDTVAERSSSVLFARTNYRKLTWSFSDVHVRRVLPLISDRIGDIGERQLTLVELVESSQLVELVPGLLFQEVLVVEIRSGQHTGADRRRILRPVPFRV